MMTVCTISLNIPSLVLLIFLVIKCQSNRIILTETLYGEVGASNYTYYTFSGERAVKLYLTLTTLKGDADLYIAGKRTKPTFDLDEHHFQSTTCGDIDEVVVPTHFVKEETPIGIGVYGHPRHDISSFILEVVGEEEDLDTTNGYEDGENQDIKQEEIRETKATKPKDSSKGWEMLVSFAGAVTRILIEVLT